QPATALVVPTDAPAEPEAPSPQDAQEPDRQPPEPAELPQPPAEQSNPRAERPSARVERPRPMPEDARPTGFVKVRRRPEAHADALVKQLDKVPELRLDVSARRAESRQLLALGAKAHTDDAAVSLMEKRDDLRGLPWLKGDACKISATAADNLEEGSI